MKEYTKDQQKMKALQKVRTRMPKCGKNKLSSDEVMFILSGLALWKKNHEILAELKERYNKTVTPGMITQYKQSTNYRPIIQKIRDEFENEVKDVELASKRRRIEELSKLYYRCLEKEKFGDAGSTMSRIQDEVEGRRGDKYDVHLTQYNQYNNFSDEELRKKLAENFQKLEAIDAEVSDAKPEGELVKNENTERGPSHI